MPSTAIALWLLVQAAGGQEGQTAPVPIDPELTRLQRELDAEKAARATDRARLDRLEAQLNRPAAPPVAAEEAPRTARVGVALSGFAQLDYQTRQSSQDQLNNATGAPLNEDRFMVRRARAKVELDYGLVGGAVEFDGNTINGTTARIINAEASLRWPPVGRGELPYVALTVGLFKTPFGFEIIQSDRDRLFMERSTAERALFPGEYDLGVRVSGGWRFLRYAAGIMNGDTLGEKLFPGRDPNGDKDFVGRVGIDAEIVPGVRLAAGFSALSGTGLHPGTPATKDVLVWRDINEDGIVQLNEIQVIPGSAPTPSQNFDRSALGGDARVTAKLPKLGELTVYGELYAATNLDRGILVADPVTAGRDLRETGFYGAVTQEITPYFMVGIRYDHYNPDADTLDQRAGMVIPKDSSFDSLDVVGAFLYPYGRFSVEYDRNTNHQGRDAAGNPINLKDNAIIFRGQVQW
jgi:hypothetical protein